MREFIEKLIGRLEEISYNDIQIAVSEVLKKYGFPKESVVQDEVWDELDGLCTSKPAIEIVNQLAEEYNNGWIPCSRELPKNGIHVLCYGKNSLGSFKYEVSVYVEEIECWMCSKIADVIAWQPLPEPFRTEKAEWKDAFMRHFTKIE